MLGKAELGDLKAENKEGATDLCLLIDSTVETVTILSL